MTDHDFARAFEAGAVTPAQFDHRAHLRLAWVYLREASSMAAALPRVREAIQRFAASAGASQKYHETITIVWMRLLADVRARGVDGELALVLDAHPELADKERPFHYYSRERLFSDEARSGWVEPDRRSVVP